MRHNNTRNPEDRDVAVKDEIDKWVKVFKDMSEFEQFTTLHTMIQYPDVSNYNRVQRIAIYKEVVTKLLNQEMDKHLAEKRDKANKALKDFNEAKNAGSNTTKPRD